MDIFSGAGETISPCSQDDLSWNLVSREKVVICTHISFVYLMKFIEYVFIYIIQLPSESGLGNSDGGFPCQKKGWGVPESTFCLLLRSGSTGKREGD